MAGAAVEQGKQQEVAPKVVRPQVRRVWLEPGIYLPDAGNLTSKPDMDAESNAGKAHKLAFQLGAIGVLVEYTGARQGVGGAAPAVPHRVLIPWGSVRAVEVGEDWER